MPSRKPPEPRRVKLTPVAARRVLDYERLITDAVRSRDTYAVGLLDGLGVEGTITGFDEATGELLLDPA